MGLWLLAFAQVTTGIISGTVKDTTGAVMPGVSVKITHLERGANRESVTDDTGHFVFPQLAAVLVAQRMNALVAMPSRHDHVELLVAGEID